jgi:hypothetical protein
VQSSATTFRTSAVSIAASPFADGAYRFSTVSKGSSALRSSAGPAALSIQTSVNGPYADRETPDGVLYDYRGLDPDHRDKLRPDRERLAERYERFLQRAG